MFAYVFLEQTTHRLRIQPSHLIELIHLLLPIGVECQKLGLCVQLHPLQFP